VERVYLSLGSNLGERGKNIARAIAAMGNHGLCVLRQSALYETEPVDFLDQPWFLNCVVEAETALPPENLIDRLLTIEREMGRERLLPGGPRIIDIDILFYGSRVIRIPGLEIPHPRMAERRFVLMPLNEIAPELRHPVLKRSVAELLRETADRSRVQMWR
jgi:2-amino-4-hydroxy-6-hydroxymethyldihydropteridine diphosphokinase